MSKCTSLRRFKNFREDAVKLLSFTNNLRITPSHIWSRSRVAIMGPNGAGKSTVAGMVVGELAPVSGNAWRHPSAWPNFWWGGETQWFPNGFPCQFPQFFSDGVVFYYVLPIAMESPGITLRKNHYQCRMEWQEFENGLCSPACVPSPWRTSGIDRCWDGSLDQPF